MRQFDSTSAQIGLKINTKCFHGNTVKLLLACNTVQYKYADFSHKY